MVSINCSVHVAFKTRLELPEKPGYFEKSWCVGQFRGILKTTNLGKRSPSLPRGKVSQCKGLLNSFNGGINDSIQTFWTCSNPSNIECYAILSWCWLKFHYWCAPWVWRFADIETWGWLNIHCHRLYYSNWIRLFPCVLRVNGTTPY